MAGSRRAFELTPVIDKVSLDQDTIVTVMELCGTSLFLGTSRGRLLQYQVEEETQGHRLSFSTQVVKGVKLGGSSNAPITFVRSASALNRLLVLCDGILCILEMTDLSLMTLSGSSKLKAVNACCINENPYSDDPFSVQMCLAKKKQLAVISLHDERLMVEKTCDVADFVTKLAMDGQFVCAALTSFYVIYNIGTGHSQELFPIEGQPAITRIAKEEFLLSAPGGLGMFVTSAGMSERPPIQWSQSVQKCIHCSPYVIALSETTLSVYSVQDQQQKQTLHFSGGQSIGNFDGRLMVASPKSVYALLPVPITTQIQNLLENGLVEEALELVETNQNRTKELDEERMLSLLNQVRVRAGFIFLKKFNLDRAQELFLLGELDPREVISLFPNLLSRSSNFTRTQPPLHELADVSSLTKGDKDKLMQLQHFLITLLELLLALRRGETPFVSDINTALVKLYANVTPEKLDNYSFAKEAPCDLEDCKEVLTSCKQFHAMARLCYSHDLFGEAFATWTALVKGNMSDPCFPGIDFLIEKLRRCPMETYLWKYADFVLDHDESKCVDLFANVSGSEKEDRVVTFLSKYPKARLVFLERLVFDQKTQVEKFHTQLAVTYIDLLEECKDKVIRAKFQTLIVNSSLVKPNFLLSRIEKSSMHQEKAMLYGKMGDHEKALRILVNEVDNEAAESYCDKMSAKKGLAYKQTLLQTLLKVFLEAKSPAFTDFLNRRAHEMSPVETLKLLPDDISLQGIETALKKMILTSGEKSRASMVMLGLAKSDNFNAKVDQYFWSQQRVELTDSSYCMACGKQFKSPEVTRYPNGVVVHNECATDERTCPVTGKLF